LWEIGAFFDVVASKAAFEELQRKEYIHYDNLPLQTKDGQLREVEFISNVYEADLKKVIQCNIRNITRRKEAEKALKESEIRYRRLFESAKDGILILDAETGKIIDANPFLLEILNHSQEEVIGKQLWEIGPFKDIIANRDTFQKLQHQEYIRYEHLQLQNKEGVTIHTEFVSNFYFVNERKVVQCNIRDITQRKWLEEDKQKIMNRLQEALTRIKELKGMLPICANCKKIRNDKGHWQILEGYISEHTDATFTHGMCPDCLKILYPDFAQGNLVSYDEVIKDITGRKHEEEALQESERKLKEAQRLGRIGHWECDLGTLKIQWSDMTFTLYERDPKLGPPTAQEEATYYSPEDAEWMRNSAQRTIETGEPFNIDVRVKLPEGRSMDAVVIGTPVKDARGRIIRLLGTIQDITESKQAEKVLKKNGEKLKELFEYAPVGYHEIDDFGNISAVNQTELKMLGYSYSEMIGWPVWEFNSDREESRKRVLGKLDGHLPPNKNYEIFFTRRDGTLFPALIDEVILRDEHGVITGIRTTILDITERKHVEEALRESETRLSLVFNNTRDMQALLVVEPDSRLRMVAFNRSYMKVLQQMGNVLKISLEDESLYYQQAIAGGVPVQYEQTVSTSVCTFYLDITITPVLDDMGHCTHVLYSAYDITERKIVEQASKRNGLELRKLAAHLQTIREEERVRIAREIHDELGQDLTGLKMELSSLEHLTNDAFPQVQNFQVIKKLEFMMALTDTAIGTVRRISTELRPVILDSLGLAAAIESETEEFQRKTGIKCEHDLQGLGKMDRVKEIAVFRILQESLTNIYRHAKASYVKVYNRTEGENAVFIVHDNGIGVTNEQQTNDKSLGLLGMKERAFTLGGSVEINSAKGDGTNVTVRIPLAKS
jgi:PAS domain S-box-containing protein